MKNIHIIGDSFSHHPVNKFTTISGTENFWVTMLSETYNVFQYTEPSRDLQTILDIWIKLLPNLNEDDCLIIGFPYFSRWRLPKSEKVYKNENGLINRHFGQHGEYNIQDGDLEFYDESTNRDDLIDSLRDNQIINSSIASSLNNKEIIESLYKVTPCKVLLWSWTRFKPPYKPENLFDKTDLENEMNFWETQNDVYNKTNGKYGIKGDCHWSEDCQYEFFNFVKNKI